MSRRSRRKAWRNLGKGLRSVFGVKTNRQRQAQRVHDRKLRDEGLLEGGWGAIPYRASKAAKKVKPAIAAKKAAGACSLGNHRWGVSRTTKKLKSGTTRTYSSPRCTRCGKYKPQS